MMGDAANLPKAALACAEYLMIFCKERPTCHGCPLVKKDGDCRLADKTPEEWNVKTEEWSDDNG